ncbi:phosphotriesterase-related protein [Eubacterium sp. am_0171]|uniref:Phosphotriesterase homology protein n=1 Tax=Faecalicatena contorta TaxID=39482 RepID=A0A173ZR13_9FIRM|nr:MULTISPECIES: hypothetical protein [Clostridia]MSC84889.1 phosphotriesterase-related protein [Eubacterium sp. BIOML-A1]MSD07177.1 phosphotriesterase-related protein [Eubacterium sp. BIOML-A2]RYT16088.1 phosphotriesterase-related protein [Eubacterium sp. am_0171]CUN77658.1 Phosphotriesterase homology protein [[Eubacterium] contortum] [Faecalicatena contorta]
MIQTVNGKISPEELGITMCHEHLALDLSPVRGDKDSDFDDTELILDEIRKMQAYGVKSVVEVTCNDMGRDVEKLRMYSKACGIHIIAATGFYLEEYHSDAVREASPEELSEIFCKDILEGIDGTDIKAGVIGEVASGNPSMGPSERNVLIAAALAGKQTGLAVTTHCQLGRLAMEQARLFEKYGMDPAKIVLGHLDLANDRTYYEEVLKTGVNIGFDTIGKTAYLSDEVRADNLMWLLERGWEERIVLSQDISRKSYLSSRGKYSGYMTVMKDFVPLLKEWGIQPGTLNKLLIDNPARIFDKVN